MDAGFPYERPRFDLEPIAAIAPMLSEGELRLLIDVVVNGGASVRKLASRTGLSTSSVQVALASLEGRKLIEVRRGAPGESSVVFAALPRVAVLRDFLL